MQDRNVLASKLKLDQLILRKIIKIVAIRCHILKLKCIIFDFVWGSAPEPAGELTALPQNPYIAGFKGPTSKGGEGKDKEGRPVFSVQFVGKPTRVTSLEGDDDEIAYFSVR